MLFSNYSVFNNWVRIAILIYIINYSKKSFKSIDSWLKDLKTNSSPDVKIFLVGNKSDLEDKRTVSIEEARQIYDDLELDYFIESSAKTGLNTDKIFVQASKILYKEYLKLKRKENGIKIITNKKLENDSNIKEKTKGCCWWILKII